MSSERARVLLIGFGPTSASALDSLVECFDVVGVVRDGEDAVCQRARGLGIDVYAEGSLKAIDAVVSELQPACVVVSSFDRILPAALIAKSRFVNVHYAPLPQYRGRANVNWALINGERQAGISIHTIVPGLDAAVIPAPLFGTRPETKPWSTPGPLDPPIDDPDGVLERAP